MLVNQAILGFIAGAAAGAVAGILFAPESGATTRRKMLGRAREEEPGVDSFTGWLEKMRVAAGNNPQWKQKEDMPERHL